MPMLDLVKSFLRSALTRLSGRKKRQQQLVRVHLEGGDEGATRRSLLTGEFACGRSSIGIDGCQCCPRIRSAWRFKHLDCCHNDPFVSRQGHHRKGQSSRQHWHPGDSSGTNGIGIFGGANTGTGAAGVWGSAAQGYGVKGVSTNAYGVYGKGGYNGVYGTGGSYGVIGAAPAVMECTGPARPRVYASGGTYGVQAYGSTYGVLREPPRTPASSGRAGAYGVTGAARPASSGPARPAPAYTELRHMRIMAAVYGVRRHVRRARRRAPAPPASGAIPAMSECGARVQTGASSRSPPAPPDRTTA